MPAASSMTRRRSAREAVPSGRWPPYDNNLGVRSIAPAAGLGDNAFVASINPDLSLSNPYSHRPCSVRVGVDVPEFLRRLGWRASVEPTSGPITLPPGGDCKLKLRITTGQNSLASDVRLSAAERRLRILCADVLHDPTDIHGIILGGVTYEVDRDLSSPRA